jgi:hypothetical protein
MDEGFCRRQNFVYQLRRCRFGIQPQHGFRTRGTKEQPGVSTVAFRSIQRELDAINIFNSEDFVLPEVGHSTGARAAHRGFLYVIVDVQVATSVMVRSVLLLQTLHQLRKRLLLFRHYRSQQQRIEHAIALGDVTRHPNGRRCT